MATARRPGSIRVLWLSAALAFAAPRAHAQQPQLTITPSDVVLATGDYTSLNAVDQSGHPVTDALWSLSVPIADLHVTNGEVLLVTHHAGRATLTATSGSFSASVPITVLADKKLPPATVGWSLVPTPGHEVMEVRQATPVGGTDLFVIEGNSGFDTVVRALRTTGGQLWMRHLNIKISPATLKETITHGDGVTTFGSKRLPNAGQMLIGEGQIYLATPTHRVDDARVPKGQEIWLRDSGDGFGGLVFLGRAHDHDFVADLSPEDGHEIWRYVSPGRLHETWTVDLDGDIGIVETTIDPPSGSFLILDGKTGAVSHRISFPNSTSQVKNFTCTGKGDLSFERPSRAGSVFTSDDGNMYLQVQTHNESAVADGYPCLVTSYSVQESLSILRVTPAGEPEWRRFQDVHADGDGPFVAQPGVLPGHTIPDGLGGVLAAWTYFFPGSKAGEKPRFEARLSRVGPSGQQDYTFPILPWSKNPIGLFDDNMVLGEDNLLYATNGKQLISFGVRSGQVNWVRDCPSGEVKLQGALADGGLLLTAQGRIAYFNREGNGIEFPQTVAPLKDGDIGLAQFDLFDKTPAKPLQLRDVQPYGRPGVFFAVEDGAPLGSGRLIYFHLN
jgi:outer membrane protein assembly factor BamB